MVRNPPFPREGEHLHERPLAAFRLLTERRSAASPDRSLVHRAAFFNGKGRQSGPPFRSLPTRHQELKISIVRSFQPVAGPPWSSRSAREKRALSVPGKADSIPVGIFLPSLRETGCDRKKT